MKRLQVYLNNEWKYVFCRNERFTYPVTCKDRRKAIKGDSHSLLYFERYFGNHKFRISK